MPTPHGSYYKQLSELLDDQAQTPQVGVVCDTFSACISLVAKSDFSILPEEMGCDPLHGQGLVMLPVSEILPKAAYYLIQRRDNPPDTTDRVINHAIPARMRLSAKLKLHKKIESVDIRQTLQYTQRISVS